MIHCRFPNPFTRPPERPGRHTVSCLLVVAALGLITGCANDTPRGMRIGPPPPREAYPADRYTRIISLAPSVTEILFALDLDDRVAGVTDFCAHPPEVENLPRIGGYYNVNFEKVVELQPDLIVTLGYKTDTLSTRLDALGIPYLEVRNFTPSDIIESVTAIGRTCGVPERANLLADTLHDRVDAVRARAGKARTAPKTLICLGRNEKSAGRDDIYAAGPGSIFAELLAIAGGVNAYQGSIDYPVISREQVAWMNPDVIIELSTQNWENGSRHSEALKKWRRLEVDIRAVTQGRVYVIGGNHVMIPGPRFVKTLEQIADCLYPPPAATPAAADQPAQTPSPR